MKQTPIHEHHNPDLLNFIPKDAANLIEIGCSSGALAREFKKINPNCNYLGVEIDPDYAELANRFCDETLVLDIESAGEDFFQNNKLRDCWIFGDTLEHLRNPSAVLSKIKAVIPENGSIVACIPNMQHWSIQARLSFGDLRYEDSGLLDKTHLRWFTRITIIETFLAAGFSIIDASARIFDEPQREQFMPAIKQLAIAAGADPEMAVTDSMPLQYVIRAISC